MDRRPSTVPQQLRSCDARRGRAPVLRQRAMVRSSRETNAPRVLEASRAPFVWGAVRISRLGRTDAECLARGWRESWQGWEGGLSRPTYATEPAPKKESAAVPFRERSRSNRLHDDNACGVVSGVSGDAETSVGIERTSEGEPGLSRERERALPFLRLPVGCRSRQGGVRPMFGRVISHCLLGLFSCPVQAFGCREGAGGSGWLYLQPVAASLPPVAAPTTPFLRQP